MAWFTRTDPLFDGWGRAGREAIGLTDRSSIPVSTVEVNDTPGSGGRPPRPPPVNELAGRSLRAAQASRNWLLASRKVSGRTTKLLKTSVVGAVMVMVPETFVLDEASITLCGSGVRIS